MLLVLTILLIILGIGVWAFADWCEDAYKPAWRSSDKELNSKFRPILHFFYNISESIKLVGGIIGCIGGAALFIMLFILPLGHLGIDGYVEADKERYKALTYKVESDSCRDEFGLLSKEVIDEIQEWNEAVVKGKTLQRDFWVGIFYPNIYDDFETIDYEKYVR